MSTAGSPTAWLDADSLPVGVLVADPDGWVTETNRAWSDLTTLDSEESLGSGWLRCLQSGEQGAVLHRDRAVGAVGGSRVDDHRIGAAGGRRWTRWSMRADATTPRAGS
ncbi:MAG: PAS domain-containing protein [Acidimicrobiales bacterium]